MHSSGDQKLKSRKRPDGKRPLFVAQDAWLLVELPVLFAVAALSPERRWARVAFHMERFKARARRVFSRCHSPRAKARAR